MSKAQKQAATLGGAMALLVALATLTILTGLATAQRVDREILLVARDMAFWLGKERNPTLSLSPGERVRIILRNEDPGVEHDFVAPALKRRTRLTDAGEQASVTITAPTDGSLEYLCSVHPVMMRGRIAVRAPASAPR